MRILLLPLLAAAVSSCDGLRPATSAIPSAPNDWRATVTADDRERLRDWRDAFMSALKAARASGHGEKVAAEGPLLEPDAALAGPAVPNGDYRCRVIKLGAKSPGLLDYIAYPAFTCRITPDGNRQRLAKVTGSQRQVGVIFANDALRQVFLGTLVLGDERQAQQYGRDRERNVAGYIERIGPARWRLLMPRPHFESQTDVLELIPAA